MSYNWSKYFLDRRLESRGGAIKSNCCNEYRISCSGTGVQEQELYHNIENPRHTCATAPSSTRQLPHVLIPDPAHAIGTAGERSSKPSEIAAGSGVPAGRQCYSNIAANQFQRLLGPITLPVGRSELTLPWLIRIRHMIQDLLRARDGRCENSLGMRFGP